MRYLPLSDADRRVDVRGRLDRFHNCRLASAGQMAAGIGHLDENHVAELALREIGDSDRGDIAVDPDPLMLLGVIDAHRPAPLRW
jgi:hypothetical protein